MARRQPFADLRRFFRTPKGLLLIILLLLLAVAAWPNGFGRTAPGVLSAVLVAALIDLAILRWHGGWEFPSGAVLTGLIVAMILTPQEPWYVAASTSALAILSKYALRTRSANVFNPAALAIVGTYYIFNTGQSWWGALPDAGPFAWALLVATGIFIADRVNKMPLVLAFLGSYFLLFTLTAFLGDPSQVAEIFRTPDVQAMLFFVFFMLTDPPTSPVRHADQLICGAIVGIASYAVFELAGVVYFLLAGVLVGNVWEARRRSNQGRRASLPELGLRSRMPIVLLAALLVLTSSAASAQIDLTGSWASRLHEDYIERGPGSDLGDFSGLPLSDEGRTRALSYSPTLLSMTERQCMPWSPWSFLFRPLGLRIWSDFDSKGAIVAWHIGGDFLRDIMTIWMDGRPHPTDNAFYQFSGFTTGTWEGDTLTVRTTHLKATTIRRGNGIPASDQATVTAHLTRHDDLLTIMLIQEDPVYLTEPYIVSRTFQLDPRGNIGLFNVCNSATEIPRLEDTGIVPHYLPGENTEADHMLRTYNLPRDAAMGYAIALYPEYRKTLKGYAAPAQCTRYCCGWIEAQGRPEAAPNLVCKTDGGK